MVDGTGRSPTSEDVRIVGDRIVEVAPDLSNDDSFVIDIRGRVLTPGFLDMHAHSEGPLWREPHHEPKLRQGVTFELLGQDGLGFVPIHPPDSIPLLNDRLVGWHGHLVDVGDAQSRISTFGESLEARGVGVNFGLLVPHGTIRLAVMGDSATHPSPDQLQHMTWLLKGGLHDGAFGLSTGLAYSPAAFASTEELIHLCRALTPQGVFVPHLRDYGDSAMNSYREGIVIAEQSQVHLHLTHAVMNGPSNKDAADRLMRLVDESSARISLDVYPYDAGSTYLHVLLPRRALGLSDADLLPLVSDKNRRPMLAAAFAESGIRWDQIKISGGISATTQRMAGLSLAEISQLSDTDPVDTFCDILTIDRLTTTCIHFNGHMGNIDRVLEGNDTAIASDSILVGEKPHPRGFGTFARLFERYVDSGRLSISEAVRRVTGLPARILGLQDRGVIAPGAVADIVCFDPARVREHSTYEDPRRVASGFDHVFINGRPIITGEEISGELAGRFVQRQRPRFESRIGRRPSTEGAK